MDKCLIQIQDKGFPSDVIFSLWANQVLGIFFHLSLLRWLLRHLNWHRRSISSFSHLGKEGASVWHLWLLVLSFPILAVLLIWRPSWLLLLALVIILVDWGRLRLLWAGSRLLRALMLLLGLLHLLLPCHLLLEELLVKLLFLVILLELEIHLNLLLLLVLLLLYLLISLLRVWNIGWIDLTLLLNTSSGWVSSLLLSRLNVLGLMRLSYILLMLLQILLILLINLYLVLLAVWQSITVLGLRILLKAILAISVWSRGTLVSLGRVALLSVCLVHHLLLWILKFLSIMSSVVFRVISHLILVALIAISSLRNAPCFRSF